MANDFACRNDSCLSALLWKPEKQSARAGYIPLPVAISRGKSAGTMASRTPITDDASDSGESAVSSGVADAVDGSESESGGHVERGQLIDAMERAGWVQAKAARLLGLTPRQMGYALRKHDIEIKRF